MNKHIWVSIALNHHSIICETHQCKTCGLYVVPTYSGDTCVFYTFAHIARHNGVIAQWEFIKFYSCNEWLMIKANE